MAFEHYSVADAVPNCQRAYVEDPMSLYSVVHKDRKNRASTNFQDCSESPCSIENQLQNYEDTESEYASELRRQTYLQKIGTKYYI
jgi:hypothetical protein